MKLDLSPFAMRGAASVLPANGRISDVRRNGWLYSLEHALLDAGLKLAQPAMQDGAPPVPEPQAMRKAAVLAKTAQDQPAKDQPAEGKATPSKENKNLSTQTGSTQSRSTQNQPSPGKAAPEQPGADAADSRGAQPASKACGNMPICDGAPASAWAWLAANSPAALQSVPDAVASKQAPQALPLGPTGAPVALMPATSVSLTGGALLAMATAPVSQPDIPASKTPLYTREPESAAERSASAFDASSSQRYGRQQLHVHVGDEGMQAWVRDADLSRAAAFRVAGAFFQDARNGSTRLAALTINGKKFIDAAASRRASSDYQIEPGEFAPQPGDFEHGN